jgi:hypothetical protein
MLLRALSLLLGVSIFFACLTACLADDKPWARGVPESEQAIARKMLAEGNQRFEESQYVPALEIYRRALSHWDHPLIRYNIAVCLVNLDQSVEAYDNLERSLAFGEAPLGAEIHARALTYKKLLLGQLAELKVRCDESDAVVTLDGKPLFVAPGAASRRVVPGPHQLVVKKPGYATLTHELVLFPNRPTEEVLRPTKQTGAVLRRRWPQWKPWLVFGAGLAVAVAGIPLEVVARSQLDQFDQQIGSSCPNGCSDTNPSLPPVPAGATSLRDRANIEHIAAITSFSVGGALLVAGTALLVLNTPRAVAAGSDGPRAGIRLLPSLAAGPGYGAVGLSGAF